MNALKTTLIAAAVLATGVAVAGPFAGKTMGGCDGDYSRHAFKHEGAPMTMDSERMMTRMSAYLDLSVEQQTAIKAIFDSYQPQLQAAAQQMQQGRASLSDMKGTQPVNDTQIEQLAKAQGDNLTQMILLRSKLHNEMNAILTAEQQEKMGQMMQHKRPF